MAVSAICLPSEILSQTAEISVYALASDFSVFVNALWDARWSSRERPELPSRNEMPVSNVSGPSSGLLTAPTLEGSSPSSFANVCGGRQPREGQSRHTRRRRTSIPSESLSSHPPFAPGVDDLVSEDEAASSADEVSRPKLLDDRRLHRRTLWARQVHSEIRASDLERGRERGTRRGRRGEDGEEERGEGTTERRRRVRQRRSFNLAVLRSLASFFGGSTHGRDGSLGSCLEERCARRVSRQRERHRGRHRTGWARGRGRKAVEKGGTERCLDDRVNDDD